MNEEIESMTRYDVFEAVDESAAKGQQILTCKWVMKRKAKVVYIDTVRDLWLKASGR